MTDVISETYGRPGGPGAVTVEYWSGLHRAQPLKASVGFPGKGGAGGPAAHPSEDGGSDFVDRGGAGGGRENVPLIDALKAYSQSLAGTELQPRVKGGDIV